jgi:hypothetical protein
MTPNQQAQKDRARAEAEQHMKYSAVDQKRDSMLAENTARDARIFNEEAGTTRSVRDSNNAYAGEE